MKIFRVLKLQRGKGLKLKFEIDSWKRSGMNKNMVKVVSMTTELKEADEKQTTTATCLRTFFVVVDGVLLDCEEQDLYKRLKS